MVELGRNYRGAEPSLENSRLGLELGRHHRGRAPACLLVARARRATSRQETTTNTAPPRGLYRRAHPARASQQQTQHKTSTPHAAELVRHGVVVQQCQGGLCPCGIPERASAMPLTPHQVVEICTEIYSSGGGARGCCCCSCGCLGCGPAELPPYEPIHLRHDADESSSLKSIKDMSVNEKRALIVAQCIHMRTDRQARDEVRSPHRAGHRNSADDITECCCRCATRS
jgi:hypothetical protein